MYRLHTATKLKNTKISKYKVPIFGLGGPLDSPFTRSNLSREQGPESHDHLLDTVEIAYKLESILLSKTTSTADDLHESLHGQDLSGRPLLQAQQRVPSVFEAQLLQSMLVVPKDY